MLVVLPTDRSEIEHEKCKNSTNRLWNKCFIEIQCRCVKDFINVGKLGLEVEKKQEMGRGVLYKGNREDGLAGTILCEEPPRTNVLVYFIECQSAACATW